MDTDLKKEFIKGVKVGFYLWVMFVLTEIGRWYYSGSEFSFLDLVIWFFVYLFMFSFGFVIAHIGRKENARK